MIPRDRNRETSQRQTSTRQVLLLSFVIAFALNFTWEMLQMPAYTRLDRRSIQAWLFCGDRSYFRCPLCYLSLLVMQIFNPKGKLDFSSDLAICFCYHSFKNYYCHNSRMHCLDS